MNYTQKYQNLLKFNKLKIVKIGQKLCIIDRSHLNYKNVTVSMTKCNLNVELQSG